jgi:hypothetical protein
VTSYEIDKFTGIEIQAIHGYYSKNKNIQTFERLYTTKNGERDLPRVEENVRDQSPTMGIGI